MAVNVDFEERVIIVIMILYSPSILKCFCFRLWHKHVVHMLIFCKRYKCTEKITNSDTN